MLFLKFIQAMVRALNSEGTPAQVAAGMAFGAALGLTPLASLHNLGIVLMVLVLNVSLAGFSLGWTLFIPVGFLLDPLFDAVGTRLLGAEGLQPLWTRLANMPLVPFTNFHNTIVLGSLLFWVLAWAPIYLLARWAVVRYRATVYERLRNTRVFQAVRASGVYRGLQLVPAVVRFFRWKAIVPMALFLALFAALYVLFIDRIVRRTIELAGSEVVGARVEVESARLRLIRGTLEIKGMQVTNPNAPMTNLMEIPEITADLNTRALLMKKGVVESLMVHGVRFGTPRRTSGALPDLPPTAGRVTRRLVSWAGSIPVPTLDLEGIVGTVVNIPSLNADSLRTLRQARAVVALGDSLRTAWETSLRGLDPRPTIDSAQALLARLQASEPRRMNAAQLAAAANDIRANLDRVNDQKARLSNVRREVDASLGSVRAGVASLDAARRADDAWARGLVRMPSLDAPDVSLALFGDMVKERLKPVMYWVNVAEEHVPPGLDPRRQRGPRRLRKPGTNFEFPMRESFPQFLVRRAEADLAIGGQTVAAGAYRATATGLTNEPAVYGLPTTFRATRASTIGPVHLDVGGLMDHTGHIALDSLRAFVPRVQIPSFAIPKAGARLDIGDSANMTLLLRRTGASLAGVWRLESDAVRWLRDGETLAANAPPPRPGSREWAEALLWRSISTLRNVVVEAELAGPLVSPSIAVTTNVGDVVSANLRQALGAELQRAERMIRAEVDQHVNAVLAQARAKVQQMEREVAQRLGVPEQQVRQVETQLQEQLNRYTQVVPGVRLPNLPGIPRPRP